MPAYGMEGTVLIFGGFAFNAVVCALLLQPVSWHLKKGQSMEKFTNTTNSEEFAVVDKVRHHAK